jgi:L-seryl-tRNA(Ser) seleniumtransferase
MPNQPKIYEELDIPTVINAASTKTRIGGSLIREEALEAMNDAAGAFVRISDLQARASKLIADVTGAEAGYVASGAAATLTLAAAACIAGDDPDVMARLPDTEGVADEIIMPRTHRNGYDHAIRGAGATIVDIGNNDHTLGTGSNNVEPWEIERAITEDTVAIAYMEKPYTTPPLESVVEIAHRNDIYVIVDAAAELPPAENLHKFVETGADLVSFSGGKAICGPQSTGIVAGREHLIQSMAFQHLDFHVAEEVWDPPADLIDRDMFDGVPRTGVGRPLKVGKEELAGIIRALELFVEEDQEAVTDEWRSRVAKVDEELSPIDGVTVERTPAAKTDAAPTAIVTLNESVIGLDATTLVANLRRENPRIFVGADKIEENQFTVNPMCLAEGDTEYVIERLLYYLE